MIHVRVHTCGPVGGHQAVRSCTRPCRPCLLPTDCFSLPSRAWVATVPSRGGGQLCASREHTPPSRHQPCGGASEGRAEPPGWQLTVRASAGEGRAVPGSTRGPGPAEAKTNSRGVIPQYADDCDFAQDTERRVTRGLSPPQAPAVADGEAPPWGEGPRRQVVQPLTPAAVGRLSLGWAVSGPE